MPLCARSCSTVRLSTANRPLAAPARARPEPSCYRPPSRKRSPLTDAPAAAIAPPGHAPAARPPLLARPPRVRGSSPALSSPPGTEGKGCAIRSPVARALHRARIHAGVRLEALALPVARGRPGARSPEPAGSKPWRAYIKKGRARRRDLRK